MATYWLDGNGDKRNSKNKTGEVYIEPEDDSTKNSDPIKIIVDTSIYKGPLVIDFQGNYTCDFKIDWYETCEDIENYLESVWNDNSWTGEKLVEAPIDESCNYILGDKILKVTTLYDGDVNVVLRDNGVKVLTIILSDIADAMDWINKKLAKYGFKLVESKKVNVDDLDVGDHYYYNDVEYIKTEIGLTSYKLDDNTIRPMMDKMVIKKED